MERVKLLGTGIDTCSFDEAVEYVKEKKGQVITINPEMIEYAHKDQTFAGIVDAAELVIPDGIGVQLGLKALGYNVNRIPGVEFAKRLIAEFEGHPVALIGAKPHILAAVVESLKNEFPGLSLVYAKDGYFEDSKAVLKEVAASNPELVLVALGSPKQEEFISELKKRLPEAVMIGVGGSFDVWSGSVKRAPEIYRKLGLEWLYRTVKEPKRFKRIFPALPLFVIKVLREKWS